MIVSIVFILERRIFMKLLKRLTSCALIFTVFLATQSVTFASIGNKVSLSANSNVINSVEATISDNANGKVVLRGEDYSNGDACFYMIKNGEILSSSYVDRDKMINIHTDYIKNVVTEESYANVQVMTTSNAESALPLATTSYVSAGKVGYLLYRVTQGETFKYGPSYLKIQYSKDSFNTRYDIKGKYKDQTALAARLASLFLLTSNIAIPLTLEILDQLGVLESAINFIIGTKYVKATQTVMTWRAEGGTSSQKIEGSKYVFTMDGSSIHTDYEGDYYASNSIANKNKTLAIKLAKKYFPGYSKYEVYSWS